MYRFIYTIIFAILLQGCSWFATRVPEDPTSSGLGFKPPTTPDIVISNLQNSFTDNNAENYVLCFTDTLINKNLPFQFTPSGEANARYASLFANWNVNNERAAFLSMVSRLEQNSKLLLTLSNSRFDILLPDSAVYVSDYALSVPTVVTAFEKNYVGSMRLTISQIGNGLWGISRWIDSRNPGIDTSLSTWSILKGQYSN